MFDLIYLAFFLLMAAEILLFLFLNLPFPKTWKGGVFEQLAGSKAAKTAFKVQLVLCIMVLFFFVDLHRTEQLYLKEKRKLKEKTNMGAGSFSMRQVPVVVVRSAKGTALLPGD